MALADFQLADNPVVPPDITAYNAAVTDIPDQTGVLLDTTNELGATQNMGVLIPSSSGGWAGQIGITVGAIKAGSIGRVRVYGIALGIAEGAITAGGRVRVSDTNAKMGHIKACGNGDSQIGIALNTTTTDGDPVLVLLGRSFNA